MSTVISKNVQIGADATPSNNFTWYQPSTPDGTVRLGSGNSGSVTDILSVTSTGLGIGTSSPGYKLTVAGKISYNGAIGEGADNTLSSSGTTLILGESATWSALQFRTGGSTRAIIDSSGNLGLGVTPSAWYTATGTQALQIGSGGVSIYGTGSGWSAAAFMYLSNNAYYSSSAWRYLRSVASAQYVQAAGAHQWFNASSGTAGNAISFTQAMTLDASGNLGIGTSSPTERLNVYKASSNVRIRSDADANYSASLTLASQGREAYVYNYNGELNLYNSYASGNLVFYTNSTERARIDSSGNLGVGTSSPSAKITAVNNAPSVATGQILAAFTGYSGVALTQGSTSEGYLWNINNSYLSFGTNNTERARIDSSGNLLVGTTSNTNASRFVVANTNNTRAWSFGTINTNTPYYVLDNTTGSGVYLIAGSTSWASTSDERTKDIIEPIENAVTKVSTLRAVIGKYKTDEEGIRRAFLIAQDVQAVLPEAVNVQEDETGTLGLQYTDTIPLLVAAIKEQQAIINDLKARLDAANL